MTNIYAALEIGTSRTVLAIGEAQTGQRLKVSCHAEIPSLGVRKSQILDIAQASHSVRSVLREIERNQLSKGTSITIGNAFLVVSGQHIKADVFQGTAQIARRTVSNDDIDEVVRSSRAMTLPRERELLDVVDLSYFVDDFGTTSPRGMAGRILKLDTLHIHAEANRINDARTAAGEAHLDLREPLFAATCAADAVLSDAERRDGVLVLDLGGGTTGYAIYADGTLASTGVIGIGGDHITNDIATAFQTTQAQAESMKLTEASAVLGGRDDASVRVSVPGASPLMEQRTVSRHSLDTVVNARCGELADIIRETLDNIGLLHRLHAGIVLTGGGAAMHGLDELLRRELGTDVRIGAPVHIDGLEGESAPASFAAISGALMYAHRNYEEKSFFQTIFGGFKK